MIFNVPLSGNYARDAKVISDALQKIVTQADPDYTTTVPMRSKLAATTCEVRVRKDAAGLVGIRHNLGAKPNWGIQVSFNALVGVFHWDYAKGTDADLRHMWTRDTIQVYVSGSPKGDFTALYLVGL